MECQKSTLITAVIDFCNGKLEYKDLERIIASGINLNEFGEKIPPFYQTDTRYDGDYTALYYACLYDNITAVKMLIDAGADVNAGNEFKPVFAFHKKLPNRIEIMSMLIAASAELDVFNECEIFSRTPFMSAIMFDDLEMVRFLIDRKCKIEYGDVYSIATSECMDDYMSKPILDLVGEYIGYEKLYKIMKKNQDLSDNGFYDPYLQLREHERAEWDHPGGKRTR